MRSARDRERERPDVALVGLGLDSSHALELIGEIVREAAKRGIFAYILHDDPVELARAIDITRRRRRGRRQELSAPGAAGARAAAFAVADQGIPPGLCLHHVGGQRSRVV